MTPQKKLSYEETLKFISENERGFKTTGASAEHLKGQSQLITAKVGRAQFGLGVASMFKPVLVWLAILLLVVGPGLLAVTTIIKSMTWWMWVAFIAIGILIVRNR